MKCSMTMLDSAAPFRESDRGGHFAAFEQPGLFVEQLRTFLRQGPSRVHSPSVKAHSQPDGVQHGRQPAGLLGPDASGAQDDQVFRFVLRVDDRALWVPRLGSLLGTRRTCDAGTRDSDRGVHGCEAAQRARRCLHSNRRRSS